MAKISETIHNDEKEIKEIKNKEKRMICYS